MPSPKFKPGQSGNPKGRPKDKTPATMLRKSIATDMPEIITTLVKLAKGGEIIRATMAGQIPPDIGSQLITALAHQVKIVEIDELTKRIEALEASRHGNHQE